MGRTCSAHGANESGVSLNGRNKKKDRGVDEKIILICISGKWYCRVWIRLCGPS
jgi:hypothetical protein